MSGVKAMDKRVADLLEQCALARQAGADFLAIWVFDPNQAAGGIR
jgi:hypothetical protein